MNGRDERGPWYLLTGLVLGVVLGLAFAWGAQPVRYTDTLPASLRADFKDEYRALIAAAYLGNADLTRARARLALLEDEDMFRALTEQAQRTLAENGSDREAQALGVLAVALGQAPPGPAQVVTQPGEPPAQAGTAPATGGQPSPPLPSATPTATTPPTRRPTLAITPDTAATQLPTLEPSATPPAPPTPTSSSPFILLSQEKLCEARLSAPEFRIEALDRFNNPVAGVLVIVTWAEGEERFFTGLKPEKGAGYADFAPQSGVLYSVRLGESGAPVDNVAAVMCPQSSGAPTWGAWLLQFVQP